MNIMNQELNILHQRKAPNRSLYLHILTAMALQFQPTNAHVKPADWIPDDYQYHYKCTRETNIRLIESHSSNAQVHVLLVPSWFYFSPRSGLNVPWGNIFWPPTQIFAVFQSDLFFMHMWQHWLEINNSEPIYKRNANKVKKLLRLKPSQNAIP